MLSPLLNIASYAARKAGKYILNNVNHLYKVTTHIKSDGDPFTEIDIGAEKIIIEHILKHYPSHKILTEESGVINENESDEHLWIIDPIDGTRNFIHEIPYFCISVAYQHNGILQDAIIYHPLSNEEFSASKGSGATLNQKRMRMSAQQRASETLMAICQPYQLTIEEQIAFSAHIFVPCSTMFQSALITGSAALNLAYLADNRFSGCIFSGLNAWDMAAGILLIEESGGLVCDFEQEQNMLSTGNLIAASNEKILQTLITQVTNYKKSQSKRLQKSTTE